MSEASERLDAHVRHVVKLHFSEDTGTPFWLDWARKAGWSPRDEVRGFADLQRFGPFVDLNVKPLKPSNHIPLALGHKYHI